MSVHESTYNALKEMGIDPVIAREAASRFHNVEPAVNWCFGDGANWTPAPARPVIPPTYDTWRPQRAQGTSVEHREVLDLDAPSSTEPSPSPGHGPTPEPASTPAPIQFGSNNPFRQNQNQTPTQNQNLVLPSSPLPPIASLTPPPPLPKRNIAPAPSSSSTIVGNNDDDEDEDLRRAIELSQSEITVGDSRETLNGGPNENDSRRQDRERSVRATGPPPPSPTTGPINIDDTGDNNDSDGIDNMNTLFGPSNKDDTDNKMALVPSSQNNTNSMSKEDEDMDRAIQESLMTASFHSASAIKDSNRPIPTDRIEGAPLVFYSESGHSTYAANFFQAMYAVPQLREVVESVITANQGAETSAKARIMDHLHNSSRATTSSFLEIDKDLNVFRDGREPNQLPPNQPGVDLHLLFVHEITNIILSQVGQSPTPEDWEAISNLDPQRLFKTHVDGDHPQHSSYVTFRRSSNVNPDIYSHLSQILWSSDSTSQSLIELGDILTVMLDWSPGAKREIWKLDERVVLDRFMKHNATYAAQKRAHQSVMAGNARRTQDKIDRLTTHESNNYQHSISALIEHFNSTPETDDQMQNETRREMREKLERILKVLQQKVAELTLELEANSQAASGSLFDTDDPEYNQHIYILRGILFHDGALVGGNHLYSYIRGEDGRWWKIQEHEIEPIEWEAIVSDKTGLWMDGGAYMLIYSREGPRPQPPSLTPSSIPSELSQQSSQVDLSPTKTMRGNTFPLPTTEASPAEGDLIDINMTNSSVTSTRQGTPETVEGDIEMKSSSTLTGESHNDNVVDTTDTTKKGNEGNLVVL
ncbi:uncharacterized protein L201_003120 [Kwoniella dendrophila CBS 6074]|uniref:Peptidase C19 ubiquitin carboxyl-terminal hydrolase domain-containing protein n=1 Tax=Kwoniella dendrophila CBS 6074 TaxID=1295534 RepID=A0AAX4JUI5_9TREE